MTGVFTGRSPKDKYIVMDDTTKDTVWWAHPGNRSDNKPVDEKTWKHCYDLGSKQLTGKKLYVVDGYSGTNEDTRMCVRFVMEVAWQLILLKICLSGPPMPNWQISNLISSFLMQPRQSIPNGKP
jgi:phosphoenolpyruvate carboxykinase (ATP)